jgi:anti-sigma factor RsiW
MSDCAQVRSLLYQYLEREAGPAEAMTVAAHLSACTACKILLARKRRLARMLEEGLEDNIPVGDDFVRSVMATIPEGPPPRDPAPKRKRGLKLAAWFGVALVLSRAASGHWPLPDGGWPGFALPSVDLPAGADGLQGLLECVRWAALALDAVAGGAPVEISLSVVGLAALVGAAASLLAGTVAASAVVAVVARSLIGWRGA